MGAPHQLKGVRAAFLKSYPLYEINGQKELLHRVNVGPFLVCLSSRAMICVASGLSHWCLSGVRSDFLSPSESSFQAEITLSLSIPKSFLSFTLRCWLVVGFGVILVLFSLCGAIPDGLKLQLIE